MTDTDTPSQTLTEQTDNDLITSVGIPLLIYIQKSGSLLPETHLNWMKNNLQIQPSELTAVYSRTIDILIQRELVHESTLSSIGILRAGIPGLRRITEIAEKGYDLIQPHCIEKDVKRAVIQKDKPYINREKPLAKVRGDEGEMKTLQSLKDTVFPKYCRYLMNVTLDSGNGNRSRTEIDILFISTCGIILIENKELNGTLQGSVGDKEWRFTAEKKNGHLMVKNPVLQNREHMKILNSIFTLRKTLYHSIAVVPEHTRLKINGSFRKNEYLVQRSELIPLMRNIMESAEEIWTRQEVNKMIDKILLMKRFR